MHSLDDNAIERRIRAPHVTLDDMHVGNNVLPFTRTDAFVWENVECAVCMDEFKHFSAVYRTDCNHLFCNDCVLRIMEKSPPSAWRCPVCRGALRLPGPRRFPVLLCDNDDLDPHAPGTSAFCFACAAYKLLDTDSIPLTSDDEDDDFSDDTFQHQVLDMLFVDLFSTLINNSSDAPSPAEQLL